MEISRIRALRGPNLWSRQTAIEAVVHCSDDESSLARWPALVEGLPRALPALQSWSVGEGAGASLSEVLGRVALALQTAAGCPVEFVHHAPALEPGVSRVIVEYSQEEVGRLSFELAQGLIEALRSGHPTDTAASIAKLQELDEDIRLGPSTGAIVQAAVARDIPFRRLTQGSLVQFGWGIHQRRIQAAEIDSTSAIAESIAQDKDLSKLLLDAMGVPVPQGRAVESLDEALQAMLALNGPVVVKPRDGNQGKGVTVNVQGEQALRQAWEAASQISSDIIVERYISGDDYRLLVVGQRLVAAARRDPPFVIGDGIHTVRQLVDRVNQDPRRGDGHATPLTRIRFDAIALARLELQGLQADDIPATGRKVVLRNNANLSTGGTATDVTEEVHPEVAARAIEAAQMVGLDVCGVDMVCQTVTRPLEEQGGAIVEVNAAPGLRMHLAPSYGKPRPLGEAIVDTVYPDGQDGRIPVVSVTGTNGKTTTVRLVTHLLKASGLNVGMTDTNGVYVGDQQTDSGDCSGPRSARSVLLHPDAQAAVFETARGGLLREGLGYDRCSVGVVTNVGQGDHLGLNFVETAEDVAAIKSIVIQNVAPDGTGVLNAADPLCVAMADRCPGAITFFCADPEHPVVVDHRAQGHRVVVRQGADIVAAQREREWRFPLAEIPLTLNGTIAFQVDNVMAAIAAAWGLGLDWAVIRRGLNSFISDARSVPGRFNLFNHRGATVIADYGHNPDAIEALVQATQAMPGQRRSVVISGAGDRRDQDLRVQTELLGAAFDDVVLYQDAAQRGRADGEVLSLLREGLKGATRARRIDEIRGEFLAIDLALSRLQSGDLCLILVDQVEEALEHIANRLKAA
jgi:cyanophycin synthetase